MAGSSPSGRDPAARRKRIAITGGIWLALALAVALAAMVSYARREIVPPSIAGAIAGPVRVGELQYRVALASGKVTPELRRSAVAAAARVPLASEPFALVGVYGMDEPQSRLSPANATALREALRRDPRSRAARLFLIRGALVEGNVGAAIRQIAELDNIDREIATNLVQEAGKRLSNRAEIVEASGALTPYPALYESMTTGFTSAARPAALLRDYVGAVPRAALARPVVRSALVQRLVDGGEVELALGLLRRAGLAPARAALIDPTFRKSSAEQPFAWNLIESETGMAERQAEGGLYTEYYGRRAGPVARQLTVLPAGSHRLAIDYEPGTGGALALTVTCAGAGEPLASLPLTTGSAGSGSGTSARRKASLSFAVPSSGCRGQWIEIAGLPQLTRTEARVVIHRVELVR